MSPQPCWKELSLDPAAQGAEMLGHLHLLPSLHNTQAPRPGPERTLWPDPSALLAEVEREMLQELEAAREFASSILERMAGSGRGSSSPSGEPGQSSSTALSSEVAEPFAVRQDVKDFAPEELAVKLVGRKLLVTGRKKTQREDGKGSCSYKHEVFKREWDVPETVDIDRLTCSVSREGQLRIDAPYLEPTATPSRIVPIQISPTGSLAALVEQSSEDEAHGRAKG